MGNSIETDSSETELKNLKVSVEAHKAAKVAAAKAGISLQDYVASAIKAATEATETTCK